MQKTCRSRLCDEWTYEQRYRIVDLETISQVVFAVTIPSSCFIQGGRQSAHRMLVMKDQMMEWPVVFDESMWEEGEVDESNTRKRERRK